MGEPSREPRPRFALRAHSKRQGLCGNPNYLKGGEKAVRLRLAEARKVKSTARGSGRRHPGGAKSSNRWPDCRGAANKPFTGKNAAKDTRRLLEIRPGRVRNRQW